MLLQTVRDPSKDVHVGWCMSEKFDGVRAIWTSTELKTRTGSTIKAPEWFVSRLPRDHGLDGELWLGHGRFDEVNTMFRSANDERWHEAKYMVFDLLDPLTIHDPYCDRYRLLQKLDLRPPLVLVKQQPIDSLEHATNYLHLVVDQGGEGIVVRDPDAAYMPNKRPAHIRKWKLAKRGTGVVVGHVPGRGRLKGCVGSMVVEASDGGKRFYLANSEGCRGHKAIGSTVHYKFMELTKHGVPRHPVMVTVK